MDIENITIVFEIKIPNEQQSVALAKNHPVPAFNRQSQYPITSSRSNFQ